MDFFTVKTRAGKNHSIEVYPDFKVTRSKDLMVRGKSFYAIWDEELGLWSTDEYDVQRLIDKEIDDYISNNESLKDADHYGYGMDGLVRPDQSEPDCCTAGRR